MESIVSWDSSISDSSTKTWENWKASIQGHSLLRSHALSSLIQISSIFSRSLLHNSLSRLHCVTHRLTCCRMGMNTQVRNHQPRPQGFSLKKWVGREKALESFARLKWKIKWKIKWGIICSFKYSVISFLFFFLLLGKEETQLASHVLQFIFLSDCGFRFPIAQFPSHDCTPSDLFALFWQGVRMMQEFGFTWVLRSLPYYTDQLRLL